MEYNRGALLCYRRTEIILLPHAIGVRAVDNHEKYLQTCIKSYSYASPFRPPINDEIVQTGNEYVHSHSFFQSSFSV